MPPTVIERLGQSEDALERDLSRCLLQWQASKRAMGKPAGIGYEPRDINRYGAVEVISRRVMAGASGFDEVGESYSYEAIVERYPERFADEVVEQARARLAVQYGAYGPTPSHEEFRARVQALMRRPLVEDGVGVDEPVTQVGSVTRYYRDPKVAVAALRRADGTCELCWGKAPFNRDDGTPFLEVHHVRRLADGGSDRVSNTVAVCPNCHRALHHAADREERCNMLFERVRGLIRE